MIENKNIMSPPQNQKPNPLKILRLDVKITLMCAASVMITAATLVLIAVWQSGQYNKLAQREVEVLISADLDHITQGVYNLVRTENEAVQVQVDYNLNVARHVLAAAGRVQLSEDSICWTVTNQFTNESEELILPRFLIGETMIEKIRIFCRDSFC